MEAYTSLPYVNASPSLMHHNKCFTQIPPSGAKAQDLCHVCGDRASGRHYGVISCEGCKSFFKRSIRSDVRYTCRYNYRACPINVQTRSRCQYCRLQKCFLAGMRREGIKRGGIVMAPSILSPSYLLNAHKFQTQKMCSPTYHISSLLGPNSFAKVRETLGRLSPINLSAECEFDVKVLRYIIEWAKGIPLFSDLCQSDTQKILESCWLELFVLVTAQYRLLIEFSKWMMCVRDGDKGDRETMLRHFERQVERFLSANCDHMEMECLKSLVLYNTENPGTSTIERFKEETLVSLNDYIRSRYPNHDARFGSLLLLLPGLRFLRSNVTEEFIFPELSNNPDFVSNFIRDALSLSSSDRTSPHFFTYRIPLFSHAS